MDRFEKRASEIVSQLTEDEKLGMLTTHHNAVERLGLGEFFIGTEVARGYVGREPEKISTVFPQPIGLAGTFDRELMYELGVIAGKEARAYYNDGKKGGLMLWGPTVDMERDPRWGRTEEAYGEDVLLAGELTAAYTKGMAGETADGYYMTVPTLKHFCADNNENDRDYVRSCGWKGTLVYGGVRLDGAECVKLRISSLSGAGKVTLGEGENTTEAAVPACDAYDDFAEITVSAEKLRGSDTLKISLAEGMSLLDISVCRKGSR